MTVSILVVDDDPIFGEPLRKKLEKSKKITVNAQFTSETSEAIRIAQEAKTNNRPFDIFLIDQRLEVETNGIELARTLLLYHPDAEFIILTGFKDSDTYAELKEAIRAGAFQYLKKPFRFGELENVITTVLERKEANKEKKWTKTILEVGRNSKDLDSVTDLGKKAMNLALKLGFKRARFWLRLLGDEFRCIACEGHDSTAVPEEFRQQMSISLIGQQANKSRGTFYFEAEIRRDVTGKIKQKFQPPVGEWALISLGSHEECEAVLALDHDQDKVSFSKNRKDFIDLFGMQVNAVLAEIKERKYAQQLELINELSSEINRQMAVGNLNAVFTSVYETINQAAHFENLKIAIKNKPDHETKQIHQFNEREFSHPKNSTDRGMISHIIEIGESRFLPFGTDEYRETHNVPLIGTPSKSWVGVPLRAQNETVGALILEDNEHEGCITEDDRDFLESIADLVAGAIKTIDLQQQKAWHQEQLRLLHIASEQIISYADQPELLWSFVLTVVHVVCIDNSLDWLMVLKRNGLSFRFDGYTGIKTSDIDNELLKQYWKKVDERKVGFELRRFAADLESGKINLPSRFKQSVRKKAYLDGETIPRLKVFAKSIQKSTELLDAPEIEQMLDKPLTPFEAKKCMIFSIKPAMKRRPLGLLVIGGSEQINEDTIPISYLEPFLRQVALAKREVERRELLRKQLNFQQSINAKGSLVEGSLQDQLKELATVALDVIPAERIIIHPWNKEENSFDRQNMGWAARDPKRTKPKPPRKNGLSEYILNSEEDVFHVSNLAKFNESKLPLKKRIRRRNRNALIAFRIESPVSSERLGIFYADYNYEVKFSVHLIDRFKLFISLASDTIYNYRARRAMYNYLETTAVVHEQLLASTKSIQAAGLSVKYTNSHNTERKFILNLLKGMQDLVDVDKTDTSISLILKEREVNWKTKSVVLVKKYHAIRDGKHKDKKVPLKEGLTGHVFETGKANYEPDVSKAPLYKPVPLNNNNTISEFDVPIIIDDEVVGIWNLESPQKDAYTDIMRTAIENFSRTTGQILQKVWYTWQMNSALKATKSVTEDLPPGASINKLGTAVFTALGDADTLTIWYKADLAQNDEVDLGFDIGIRNRDKMSRTSNPKDGSGEEIVVDTMKRKRPTYSSMLKNQTKHKREIDSTLEPDFEIREEIKASACVPLRSGDEVVGAMFIGYRRPKHFSKELRTLIELLAEITAANIRDSVNLANLRQEKKRQQDLLSLIEAVGETIQLDEALNKILSQLRALYSAESIGLMFYDNKKRVLEPFSISHQFYAMAKGQVLTGFNVDQKTKGGVIGMVARQAIAEKQTVMLNISNVHEPPHNKYYIDLIPKTKSILVYGLVGKKGLLGILALKSPQLNRFSPEDVALVDGVAQLLVTVISREEQRRQLNFQSLVNSRTAWAAEVAHDSKNEIGRMLNRTNWLKQEIGNNQQKEKWLEELEESIANLNDLMNASSANRLHQYNPNHDLQETVQSIISTIVERQGQSGLTEVTFNLPEAPLESNLPTSSLHRILTYLLHNAIEAIEKAYNFEAGGQITIEGHIEQQGKDQEFVLSIANNGDMIPLDIRNRILNVPIISNDPNRGHGLMFAKMLVQHLGGALWLDSTSDESVTRFTLRMPLQLKEEGVNNGQ